MNITQTYLHPMNRFLLMVGISLFSLPYLVAQQPELVLPLNHGTQIEDISFSANGQYLVSSSNGQVKLWETASGRLLRTIDKNTAKGLETDDWGGGFKMAVLSADGSLIVTARDCGFIENEPGSGNSPTNIQVWDAKSGNWLKTLITLQSPDPTCISTIALSPDARYVMAVYTAMIPTGIITQRFPNAPPPGFERSTNQTQTPEIIEEKKAVKMTSVWDIKTGTLLINRPGEQGRFSSDGKYLMSQDSNTVYWTDLTNQKVVSSFKSDTNFQYVAVSDNWSYLYTSSVPAYNDNYEPLPIEITTWDLQQQQKINSFSIDRHIGQLKPSKAGKHLIIAGFSLGEVQIWDALQAKQIASYMIDNRPDIAEDNGILSIVITEEMSIKRFQYDLATQKKLNALDIPLASSPTGIWGTLSPKGNLFVYTNQTMEADPRAELKSVDFSQPETIQNFGATAFGINYTLSRVLLSLPQGYSTAQVLGDKGEWLYFSESQDEELLFDVQRKKWVDPQLRSSQNLQENKGWRLTSIDGTSVILSRVENGQAEKKATLLLLNEEGDANWVVSTPNGLFDGNPTGVGALHYIDGLEPISIDQFQERYYEPGVLDKILAGQEAEIRNVEGLSIVNMYPKVIGKLGQRQLQIDLEERSGGIGKLSFFINGIEVEEDINRGRKKNLSINLDTYKRYFYTDRPNRIGLVAYNQEGWFKSRKYVWAYNPSGIVVNSRGNIGNNPRASARSDFDHRRAKLYALVVGTSKYRGEALNLTYADKDALAMAEALDIATKNLFTKGRRIEVLTTEATAASQKPTKENIRGILAEFAKAATPYDVVILYFAGHGISLGQDEKVQFYYLTQDVLANPTAKDTAVLQQSTISSNELTAWQSAITAPKKVMILDACQSGQLLNDISKERSLTNARRGRALDRMKNRSGMFILSGSAADQSSLEASPFGHGLLTYSLLQGMSLVASRDADKLLNVQELFQHSKDQVEKMAKRIGREQVPEMIGLKDAADYAIGLLENPNLIKVPTVKPMMAKPRFMDKQRFSDVWGIEEKLQARFVKISERGSNPPYIFVNSPAIGEAYSVQGFTTSTDQSGQLKIEGALLKGDKMVQAFAVSGKTDKIDDIVRKIIEEIELLIE